MISICINGCRYHNGDEVQMDIMRDTFNSDGKIIVEFLIIVGKLHITDKGLVYICQNILNGAVPKTGIPFSEYQYSYWVHLEQDVIFDKNVKKISLIKKGIPDEKHEDWMTDDPMPENWICPEKIPLDI